MDGVARRNASHLGTGARCDLRRTGVARHRRRVSTAVLVAVAVLFGLAWLPGRDDPAPEVLPEVVGHRPAAPVPMRLPMGAVTLADRSYVGPRLYDGPGGVLVTVPTQVVQPSGIRTEPPAGPAAWLVADPRLFVSRVRPVRVAGRAATQVVHRLSRGGVGDREFHSVSSFCGWGREREPGDLGGRSAGTTNSCWRE